MPRWLVAFILAIVLPCYGFAALGQPMTLVEQDGQGVHAQTLGDVHHPDEDGSFPGDRSDDGPAQVQADNVLDIPELFDGPRCPTVAATASTSPKRLGLSALAPPFIEGLRRPPRVTATPA